MLECIKSKISILQVLLQIAFCTANGLPLPTNVYDQIFLGYIPFMGMVIGIFVSALEISTYFKHMLSE